ncbi:tRNA lysidine(34) synthetase TilS [Pasteuria penetrans]|uniref:tRNA lysidine(34) synthetase TilS n=1 Tax=Pasteuria penetrans TaxID=86005 RepID=UPI000F920B7A|nr:tRNA lysidine(34) synthetase TilS [Pasteuria penetrans]
MLSRLQYLLRHHNWLPHGSKLLIAVSGGTDSVALLHVLYTLQREYAWGLVVAYIQHGLRGAESEAEEQYVNSLARDWKIPYVREHLHLNSRPGGTRPAGARQARYDALYRLARTLGTDRIVLAHHADDQVETMLLHLLRGTGVAGLAGMRSVGQWRDATLVRPLLTISRSVIETYIQQVGLRPCFDSSNARRDQARNRLRHDLLPQFPAYNPRYRDAFLRLAAMVQAEEEMWEGMVEAVSRWVLRECTHVRWSLDQQGFVCLPVALQRRLVRYVLGGFLSVTSELSWRLVEPIRRIAVGRSPSRRIDLPCDAWFERSYTTLRFVRGCSIVPPHRNDSQNPIEVVAREVILPVPGEVDEVGWAGTIEARTMAREEAIHFPVPPSDVEVAVFDKDRLPDVLRVRTRRPGDRVQCVGMQGTKKLKKILMEARVPSRMRDHLPLVVAGGRILWVPGIRYARCAGVHVGTRWCLLLLYRPRSLGGGSNWYEGED